MRRFLLSCAVFATLFSKAQVTIIDSVSIGNNYKDAVFYRLQDQNKETVLNNNWHLAFSVQPVQFPTNTLPSVSIRFNEGATGMLLFQKAFNDTAFFTGDTVGFDNFTKLHDKDTNIDTGAFNNGVNISQFDYGWGVYNQTSKNVVGRNVFYIKLISGIKKFRINQLVFDTLWQVQYADLDNSNLQTVEISKKGFQGKLYAYLNLETNQITDREPISSSWDLLFHKYQALDVPGVESYSSVGVWSNKGVEVAEAKEIDVNTAQHSSFAFSKALNVIGRDWKDYDAPVWVIHDSLLYFVKTKSGDIYRLRITAFSGSGTGTTTFEQTHVFSTSTAIEEASNIKLQCYPNPASGWVTVVTDNASITNFTLTDFNGRTVLSNVFETGFTVNKVNVSQLPAGIYIATAEVAGAKSIQRLIIN